MFSKDSPLLGRPIIFYRVISVIFAALILIADELLPLGVSVGEAYCALVLIGLVSMDKQLVRISAIGGTVLILVGALLSPPESELWIVWVNRTLSVFMIWLTEVFSIMLIRSIEEREESEEIKAAYELLKNETTYVKLNHDIAVLANSKQPIKDDLRDALKIVCEDTGWPVGHVYIRDEEQDQLNPTGIWYLKDPKQFESFKKVTEATTLKFGEGLPGRVLTSGKAEWITDVQRDKNFPRARQAVEIGVIAGFAFPILIGTKVMGVMEFFTEDSLEPEPRLLEVMESLGFLLGRIFERYHANLQKEEYDEHLKSLYHRLEMARHAEDQHQRIAAEGIHDSLMSQFRTVGEPDFPAPRRDEA